MKKPIIAFISVAVLVSSLFSLPLTATIFQESARPFSSARSTLLLVGTGYRIKDDHRGNSIARLSAERYGFVDAAGKIVIKPIWEEAFPFFEGLASVRRDDKYGFIDKSGNIVIQPEWDTAWRFSEGLARVMRDGIPGHGVGGKWGFIDKTGKVVIEPQWDLAMDFSNGLAIFVDDYGPPFRSGKWGFIDKTGRAVIEPQYKSAYGFSEGLAAVKTNDRWGFIDTAGRTVIEPQFPFTVRFCEGAASVLATSLVSGFIDKSGASVIPPQWDRTGDFSEGLAAVRQGERWGFIDRTGKAVIEPQFDDYRFPFSQGLACVKQNRKWGLVDKSGQFVIEPEWDLIEKYQEAYDTPVYWQAAREGDEKVYVEWLDSTGKEIWSSDSMRDAAELETSEVAQDSEPPILQYRELIQRAASQDRPNMSTFNIGRSLLIIRSVRSVGMSSDGKTVTLVLNDDDRQKFAELTRKYRGGLLFCQVSEKPLIGGIGLISAPTENGVIEFSEGRKSGDIAEYLRHRFWK